MVSLCTKDLCTGCSACYQICPVGAIEMIENHEGFLEPMVHEEKCISCGKCESVCPKLKYCENDRIKMECYAVQADDFIREVSTSGGYFSILANYILEKGGYVCGAVMNADFSVEHIVSNRLEDIERMRGSKYIQSRIGDTFRRIEKILTEGVLVLFSGTPCQVAGLRNYLGQEYQNLITVDVICHGVPSYKVLKKYLKDSFENRQVQSVAFRAKEYFRWVPNMTVVLDHNEIYHRIWTEDSYFSAFLYNLSMRKSCGQYCEYNNYSRCSDITLGDFWGISEYEDNIKRNPDDARPSIFDNIGTSEVALNTKKGKKIFLKCIGQCKHFAPITISEASARNQLGTPVWVDIKKRKRFFDLLDKYTFEKAYDYVINDKYDIAICGLWYSNNYGSLLTAMGLYRTLSNMGYEVVFVDSIYSDGEISPEMYSYISKNCNITEKYRDINHLRELNKKCDVFMVGSDQCWANHINKMFAYEFLLNFVDEDKTKISFSTSFGRAQFYGTERDREYYRYFLKQFDGVSVREKGGQTICKECFGIEAEHVIDPIFFRDLKEYEKEASLAETSTPEHYVLNYILDIRPQTPETLSVINKEIKKEVVTVLGLMVTNPWEVDLEGTVDQPSEYEFLSYLQKCDCLVTDTYHGMCMAIIFRKPFIVIINEGRGRDRFDSLLELIDLGHRSVEYGKFCVDDIKNMPDIDWDHIDRKINEFKEVSFRWLEAAVQKTHKNSVTEALINYERMDDIYQRVVQLQNKVTQLEKTTQLNEQYIKNKIDGQIYGYFTGILKNGDRILIRGGGLHTTKLMELIFPILQQKKIAYRVADKKTYILRVGDKLLDIETMQDEMIKGMDYVIVSSWQYREEIKQEIMELKNLGNTKLVDIYEELGLDKSHPFYAF